MSVETKTTLLPYLPRLAVEWHREGGGARFGGVDGSLLSVDISGFTALSERLAAKGKVGAEELIGQISGCYRGLIAVASAHGGDVLKFRGDALLIFFAGPGHAVRATAAAVEMQAFVDVAGRAESSVGPVNLRMAAGVQSGECHFALVGAGHRELLVVGPSASAVLALEDEASAGEVLVSPETAAALEPDWLAAPKSGAFLVRREAAAADAPAQAPPREGVPELELLLPPPLRPVLAGGHAEPEHRHAAAAFVRFAGTDALVADEAAALAGLTELGEVVSTVAAEFGLTWLESDIDKGGGKLYLLAGAPASAGHDEERMLRALRAIVDAGTAVPVGAGVNCGHVFAGEIGSDERRTYAVMGDTVNLAARLAARAGAGRILASAAVLRRSPTRFATEPQPFLVKGKEEPIAALWVGPMQAAAVEDERLLPLAGREAELRELRAAVDAARRRESRLVELVGEPGIGKSRLVEELRTLAVGFQQLCVRGEEYEATTPFHAFRSLLRPLVGITPEMSAAEAGGLLVPWVQAVMPDLAPWLPLLAIPFDAEVPATPEADDVDPAFRQRKVHETVEQLLQRMLLMPTLLVVEDVHWLDDASRFLLRHLTATPGPRPWLICATRRPEGESFVHHGNGVVLELAPLAPEESTQLALAALGEDAVAADAFADLVARSGGNPLFVRELVAARTAGGDDLPETVEAVITARIDLLDPTDRLLLRCAAVLGQVFDLDLLADVLRGELVDAADPERWDRLAEFAGRDGGRVRFHHDLFRTVSYEGLSYGRRRELHRRVGETLELRGGGDELAALLSVHFFAAGDREKAWSYAVAAGDRARARFANIDAAELYERALASSEGLPLADAEVAAVAEALGDVCERAARFDHAAAAYARALEVVGEDPVARSRLTHKQGVLGERRGDYAQAVGRYAEALRMLRTAPSAAATLAEVELAAAGIRHRQGRFADAIRWAERAAGHAKDADARRSLAHAYYLLHIGLTRLGRPERRHAELALAICEDVGDLLGQSDVLNNLGVEAYFAGDWAAATEQWSRSAELKRRAGDVAMGAMILGNQGEILSDQGHLDRAEELFAEAGRLLRGAGFRLGIAVTTSNLGRLAARRGRFEDAHRLLEEAAAELEEIGARAYRVETDARRAECLVLEGRHREARELAAALLADEEAKPAHVRAQLERSLGYALVQARAGDDPRPHLDESLRVAREAGIEFEAALALKALADTRVEPSAAAEAQESLDRLGVVSTPPVPLP